MKANLETVCHNCTSECDLYKKCDSPSKLGHVVSEFSDVITKFPMTLENSKGDKP